MILAQIKHRLKYNYLKILPFFRQPLMYPHQYLKFIFTKRKIFVDCGANLGRVTEEFIALKRGFEFFAFEPQPELRDTGTKLKKKYPHLPFHFYPYAVWIEDTELDFFLSERSGKHYKDASTLLSGHVGHHFNVRYDIPYKVQAIDFSAWIKKNFQTKDYIILKMDIEGAEYAVLENMLASGALDYINVLIIEFHQFMNESITLERHQILLKTLIKKVKIIEWH